MILPDTNLGRLILEHSSIVKTADKKNNKIDIDEAKKVSGGLAKIASTPYSEESYSSIQGIMKIASDCIGNLIDSFESTKERTLELEKEAEVRILLDDMINSKQIDEFDITEKVAELMSKDKRELSIIKEAAEMFKSGRQGNVFFEETENAASIEKRGMFDGVVE